MKHYNLYYTTMSGQHVNACRNFTDFEGALSYLHRLQNVYTAIVREMEHGYNVRNWYYDNPTGTWIPEIDDND